MNIIKPKSESEKEKSWSTIFNKWNQIMDDNASVGNTNIAQLLKSELYGGKCLICGKEWVKISFNNDYGKGEYYKPLCYCYVKCPRCKYYLYIDEESGKLKNNYYFCTNCTFPLSDTAQKEMLNKIKSDFWRSRFKIYYDTYKTNMIESAKMKELKY